MGQIVSSAAKPKRCNANQLSQVPTPAAGEYILVSSDNSMNAAGQGNFDCYIMGDGTTAATVLLLHKFKGEELEEKLYGKEKLLMDNVTTQPSKVYITADMVTAGEVLVFELESINNLQGALKAEKTGYTHDKYIICPAGQSATVEYTVPADFLRIYTRSSDNPMLVKSCGYSIKGDIDLINERIDELEEGTIITTEDIEDDAVTTPKIEDAGVTTAKISDSSVTRAKLSEDVKDTIASPFTLDGNVTGNTKCIPELTVYTTNVDDVNHNYYLQRLKRVDGSIYILIQQDTTNVAAIELSSFTPTTDRSIYSVGLRTDNTLIAKIVVDWTQLTDGINLTPRWKIKSENIVLVENMNALNVRLYNGVLSYINEAITDIDMRLLSDEEHDAPYRLYNLNKSATNLSFRLYRGSTYTFIENTLTTGNEIVKCGAYGITLTFDCSKIPNGYASGIVYCADIVKRTRVEYNDATDGYLQKDTIIDVYKDVFYVDANRTANSGQWFKSISEACAHVRSISPNKHQKQFEIVVMPGVYHECGILVPPYTHVHGTSRDAVIVTDTDYNGDDHSCLFDFGTAAQVAWHSDGRYGKLSNMTLRETQGRYCIHASQPYMCGLLENIAFEHYLCTTGSRANQKMVIGVGCGYSGNLFTFDGCSFKSFGHKGEVTGHTVSLTTYGNCRLNFRNCLFVNSDLYYISIGSCGNLLIEIDGCSFINGSELLAGFTANAIQPYQYLSDLYEINFIGGNNKHLVANLPCEGAAVCVEKDTPSQGDTLYIKGSIVDALFGGVNYKNGGTSVTAKAIGSLYVADAKNASNADVFQMWKRLGDCSTTAKTMSVSINGGTEQTVTLSGNYASTKPAESSIIAEINAQLSGVTFKKFSVTDRYSKLNTSEKELIFMQQDVAKFACVDKDGVICGSGSTNVHGIVLEDTARNDVAPVWTGYGIYTGMTDGDYAVGTNGTLVSSSSNVVYTCSNGVLRRV